MRCFVSNSGGNGQLHFRSGARFAPEFESRSAAFRTLADPRQSPVPLARACLQDLTVDTLSVIANPQPEELAGVCDFRLDTARMCVLESVSQDLTGNPVDLVLKDLR